MKQKIISFGGSPRPAAPDRARMKAASGKRRKRRRTGRHTLHYILIFLAAFAIFAVLSLTVFFRIEKIKVTGNTKYAEQEIIEASGIKIGDNLFRVNHAAVGKRLAEKFPYVEAVKLKHSFPPCLTIEVTQAKPLGAVSTPSGYVIIARSGRVLETRAQTIPEGTTVVSGMYLYQPQPGKVLGTGYKKEEQAEADREAEGLETLIDLVDAVSLTSFDSITMVDFSNRLNIAIVYDNRIMVELGSGADLAFKLQFVQEAIESPDLGADFEGILDASLAATSRKIWSKPANIQQEMEKRRLIQTQAADGGTQAGEAASGASPPPSGASRPENPELAVIPGTAPSSAAESASSNASGPSGASSGPSGGSTSSESASSFNELAVIPGTAPSSSGDSSPASAQE